MKWRDIKALLKKEGIDDNTELKQVHVGHGDEYPQAYPVGVTTPTPQPPVLHLNLCFDMTGVTPEDSGQ